MSWFSSLWYGTTEPPKQAHQEEAGAVHGKLIKEVGRLNRKIMIDEKAASTLGVTLKKMLRDAKAAQASGNSIEADRIKKKMAPLVRKRKVIEGRLKQHYGTKQNLELQVDQLDALESTSEITQAMKGANERSKKLIEEVSIDEIGDVMDDFLGNRDEVMEMSGLLSDTSHLADIGLDDAAMEDEIDQLEAELDMEEDALLVARNPFPDVPAHRPLTNNDDSNSNNGTPALATDRHRESREQVVHT